ncbi:hypothetical protein FNV43_RR02576 [Rhamnella rubrinervis]|uniref:G-patch domain-containing protein n=1 Tax=Rhamnella rubrinervis TaxID=2594499 RepID=A0A8K0HSE6_9ROSA|nr:hypothetical protein FNV43_RR02576 [Rhamnella rubrinervis]
MKLSFSLPSKSSSRPNSIKPSVNFQDADKSSNADVPHNLEYLTEFDASKTLTHNGKVKNVVIPPIENEWKPPLAKKMKNLEIPITQSDSSGGLQFEVESSSAGASAPANGVDSRISYGLNIRQSTKGDAIAQGSDQAVSTEDVLLQKFKYDLKRLPEDRGVEEFDDMPVEGFGAALLSGYGWKEGMGIGRNTKEDVKVMEITKRAGKHGIGFVSDDIVPSTRNKVPESNLNGNAKEKEKEKGSERADRDGVGKDVRIIGGSHEGLKGRVLEKLGNGRLVLKLSRSEETVKVKVDDVAELGSKEEERCLKRLKKLKIQEEGDRKASKRIRDEDKRENGGCSSQRDNQRNVGKQVSWLMSHIRVRIISKDLKGGRLYLKKGEVVDVVGPKVCDIAMDESKELIQGVSQDLLETALPRRGGPVIVLSGKHKGVYGNLVERDLDRETGVVEDADTLDLLNVRLEQIAEYIGEPQFY